MEAKQGKSVEGRFELGDKSEEAKLKKCFAPPASSPSDSIPSKFLKVPGLVSSNSKKALHKGNLGNSQSSGYPRDMIGGSDFSAILARSNRRCYLTPKEAARGNSLQSGRFLAGSDSGFEELTGGSLANMLREPMPPNINPFSDRSEPGSEPRSFVISHDSLSNEPSVSEETCWTRLCNLFCGCGCCRGHGSETEISIN